MKTNPTKKIGKAFSLADVKGHIVNLIAWHNAANAYIFELTSVFNNTSPDHVIDINETLAHLYGMPSKTEKVYNILDARQPMGDSAVCLSFAAEIAEREIFELSLKSVDNADTCKIQLTEKALEDMLINISIVDRIVKKINGISFFQSAPVFEHNDSNECNFYNDKPFDFLFFMLELEQESGSTLVPLVRAQEDCHHHIHNVINALAKIEDMEERREAARKSIPDILNVINTLTRRFR